MPTPPPLTRRQRQIVDFFRRYSAREGISPTLEEIAGEFGVNKVTIFGHVAELERKGVLQKAKKGISRGLQLVSDCAPEPTAHEAPTSSSPALRILGTIAAGAPIEAVEDPETFDLQDLIPSSAASDVYALRVRGESMIDDGIRNGDIVLVERRTDAHNGETVVAVLPDEEATLKRFYREDGRIRLQPANESLEPLLVDSVDVRGVVVGVVRRY